MRLEHKKYLWDVRRAAEHIVTFTSGRAFEDYGGDVMMRSAVERQFEIIGEALNQLRREAPNIVDAITDAPRIIGFRNRLIHGYSSISDAVVWYVVEHELPSLLSEVEALLALPDDDG